MSSEGDIDDQYALTAEGIRGWLERERADIAKAAELRVAEAVSFVDAFASGKIRQDDLENRMRAYSRRWGEALPGVGRSRGLSDEEILRRIDATRAWQEETQSSQSQAERHRRSYRR